MDTKRRKLLSRMGAALMMGLSLFNLGAAYSKSKTDEVPKRSGQIRKREKEQVKPELQMVANVVEEEAKAVINEQQQMHEESQLRMQTQELSGFQVALRFVALGVWAASASVFFASMIFNYPFALGKIVLSLLPGIPHVASMNLEASSQYVSTNTEMKIFITLDTNDEPIVYAKSVMQYDPKMLDFIRYELVDQSFSRLNTDQTTPGKIIFDFDNLKQDKIYADQTIAIAYFKTKEQTGGQQVSLIKEASFILKKNEKNETNNILGKAASVSFVINLADGASWACRQIDFEPNNREKWQEFAQASILPSANNWQSVDENRAVLCGYKADKVYVVFHGKDQDRMIHVNVEDAADSMELPVSELAKWDEQMELIAVYEMDVKGFKSENLSLKLFFADAEQKQIKWPARGLAKITKVE